MKDPVEVIINADGKSCTTLNPLGKRPTLVRGQFVRLECETTEEAKANHKAWQEAESERKTYEIEFVCCSGFATIDCLVCYVECITDQFSILLVFRGWSEFKPGTIHKAKIINNKAVIL